VDEMGRRVSLFSDVRALWKLFVLLRREKPEIVHTHTAKAGALGRVAAWLAGVPVIVHTYHGHVFHSYFSPTKTRIYRAVEKALGSITTQVVAISNSQREELCNVYRVIPCERTVVIQNGFDFKDCSGRERTEARKELGIAENAFVFVWAARMAPVKDVELLGEVVRMAAKESSQAYFLVVGDGEMKPRLESIVQGCNNVKLLGWRRDMDRIWCAADAAILTSRNEGTPTALIEAMAARVPFLATNVGAVRDLSVLPLHEMPKDAGHRAGNGYLAARTPEALFYCAEELIRDRTAARTMGEIGHAFVCTHFSVDRLVAEMSRLYSSLAASCRRPSEHNQINEPSKIETLATAPVLGSESTALEITNRSEGL